MHSCELIRQSIVKSGLHFFVNESPHSLWVTVRKKFFDNNFNRSDAVSEEEKLERYKNKILMLENQLKDSHEETRKVSSALEIIKGDFEDEINDHKVTIDEIKMLRADNLKKDNAILKLKEEKKNVEDYLENSENNLKKSNKIIKLKEKDIYVLKKENCKVKEDFDQLRLELSALKAQVNKEKRDQEKKIKKQEKKDFLNNLRSDPSPSEIRCEMCDQRFPSLER